jgi:Protein of unknown function (DUF742)
MALPTQPWTPDDDSPVARVVRPYTLTGGRTTPKVELPVEARLYREGGGSEEPTDANLARILAVCDKSSVAEVSAHVHMPIGVVRVLLGDLIEQGHVRVQATLTADSSQDERRELIERTLRGLRTL